MAKGKAKVTPHPSAPEPALSLSTTEFARRPVLIDGESFLMRAPDELGFPMMKRLNRLQRDLQRISKESDAAMEEGADDERLDSLIDKMEAKTREAVDLVMVKPLPKRVFERLSLSQLQAIPERFFELTRDAKQVSATQTSS